MNDNRIGSREIWNLAKDYTEGGRAGRLFASRARHKLSWISDRELAVLALMIRELSPGSVFDELDRREAAQSRKTGKISARNASPSNVCDGCGKETKNKAGAYCPTCRQRGAVYGWCQCGAAKYRIQPYCRSNRHG